MRYIVGVFLISLCCMQALYADSAKKTDFTDQQKPIVVKRSNTVFTIVLSSNPTTGYSWFLKNYDADLIKPLSRKYYPPQTKLIGAGGYEKWVFAVKEKGFIVPQTTNITLIYTRPWELQGAQVTNFKVVTTNDY